MFLATRKETLNILIPENITEEHLLKAIEEIDRDGVPIGRQSWMYDVLYKDKLYPPKVIISFANKYANGEELDHNSFKGGLKTAAFKVLKKAGLTVVKKTMEQTIDYFGQLKLFLEQASTSNLKTKHYQKDYGETKVKVSFGQGVSARIPWISFLREPHSTSNGIYPVYLLFKKQNILILAYGISETEKPNVNWKINSEKTVDEYFSDKGLENPERYGSSYVFTSYENFDSLESEEVNTDLNELLIQYKNITNTNKAKAVNLFNTMSLVENKFLFKTLIEDIKESGLSFQSSLPRRFLASLLTKPFVLLSGLSGSGKTKLAEAFVLWICQDKSQYKLVPVGADWTNREPLLGFPNALDEGKYVQPDNGVLKLVMDAQANQDRPYFLILDEMNLSHVERYFADFLSTMESSEAEIQLHDNDEIPESTAPKTLKLPKNLFIIGTVNIDETTYMFSPKVLDRANTIEFRVTKDEIEGFFKAPKDIDLDIIKAKGASMAASFLKMSLSKEITASKDAKDELVSFFEDLQKTGAEFGYRTANEMVKLITNLETLGIKDKNQSIDIAIMQKMLPKLNGSRRKLSKVLISLGTKCLKDNSVNVEAEYFGKEEADLSDATKVKYPLSFEKITRMYRNARDNGFASYAEA